MTIFAGTLARYFGMRFLIAVTLVFLGFFALIAVLDYIELMRRAADIPNVSALLVAKTSTLSHAAGGGELPAVLRVDSPPCRVI